MQRLLTTIGRWAGQRAWTRAGAVAQIVSARPARRVAGAAVSLTLMVGGAAIIALGVALMFWSDLGPGPLDVFASALHRRLDMPLSVALWSISAVLIAMAWLLGRRPGPGTLIAPFIVGGLLEMLLSLFDHVARPDSLLVRIGAHVGAVGIVGLGAGMMICSGLGAGTGELLAAATSDRTGRPEPYVRCAFEASFVVSGVVLGGPAGLGTAIVMLTIGPAVALGYRFTDGVLDRSRNAARHAGRAVLDAAHARA